MKKAKKHDPDFISLISKYVTLDAAGNLKFSTYASVHVSFSFKGGVISVPRSHLIWFLTHGQWPADGMVIDHIDDDPTNDVPNNLQELTPAANQEKRRGRQINRNYGSGKYGNGMYIYHDKRDEYFYVTHTLPRAAHKTLRTVKKSLGRFSTMAEAEAKVADYVATL